MEPPIVSETSAAASAELHDENTPLLANLDDTGNTSISGVEGPRNRYRSRNILLGVCGLMILLDIAAYLTITPQTKIFQDIVCADYYGRINGTVEGMDLDGEMCKIEPVQSEVAIINGWKDTFDQLPGIAFALPWGIAADRFGRKPVLLIGMLGCTLGDVWVKAVCWWPSVFPLRLVWFSAVWQLIGGGVQVSSSMFYVILADVYSEEERTASFFRLSAAVLVAEIFATPLSVVLTIKNPWIPFLIGPSMAIIGLGLAFLMPETLKTSKRDPTSMSRQRERHGQENQAVQRWSARILSGLRKGGNSTRFMWKDINVMLLLFVFFVGILGKQSMALLILYVSKKFKWSIGRSGLLLGLRGLVNLVLLVALLPLLSKLLQKSIRTPAVRDVRLSQGSGALLAIGSIIMFLAPVAGVLVLGLVLFALGSAFHLTARSLVTSLVLPDQVATLYTAIAAVKSVGTLIAGPVLANTFRWGLRLGERWLGMPFLAAGLLYAVAVIAVSCVRLPAD